jgi:uncharacterized LabA/DUF88 family protein
MRGSQRGLFFLVIGEDSDEDCGRYRWRTCSRKAAIFITEGAEYFAVRLREISFDGWAPMDHALADVISTQRQFRVTDFKPILRQKGIDLKMGVDIAIMAKERIADRLVIVTGDSDLVPALKLARREGLQIVLASMQTNLKQLLKEHVDIYRPRTI